MTRRKLTKVEAAIARLEDCVTAILFEVVPTIGKEIQALEDRIKALEEAGK